MAFTTSNPVVLGRPTRKSHYDVLFANTIALKERRGELNLGGDPLARVDDTSLIVMPGAIIVRVDGTNLGGLTVEVLCSAFVDLGTGEIRLRNLTTAGYIGSAVQFTNTALAMVSITGLTLTTGSNDYVLHVRGTTSTALPCIQGARLVIR